MPQTDAPAWEDTEEIPTWDETRPLLSDAEMGQMAAKPPMQFLPGGMNEPGTREEKLQEAGAILGGAITAPGRAIDAIMPRWASEPLVNPQTAPSDLAFRKAHPVIGGVESAVVNLAKSFTSPIGIATLGMGALPGAAQRAVSLAFAGQMASSFPQLTDQIVQTYQQPDSPERTQELARLFTEAAGTGAFTALATKHGLTPSEPILNRDQAMANRIAVRLSMPERLTISPQEQARLGLTVPEAAPPRFEDTSPIPEGGEMPQTSAVQFPVQEIKPTEVSNASSQQSAAPPDGGVRTRSEVGQLPEGNVEAADARLRGNEGEVPANLPPQEGALGRGGIGKAPEEKTADLSKEASNVEKGAEIEKQDHRIARENPAIATEIAQEEIALDPNAYKGDEVKSVVSPPETLVQAAFRLPTGKILKVGAFHDASKLPKKYLADPSDPMTDYAGEVEPGWVTSTGRFVGREEATTVGKQSGQVPESYNYPAHHRVVKLPESEKPPPENRVKTGETEATPPATSAGVETKQPTGTTNLRQPSTQSQGPGTTAGEKPTTPVVGEQKPPLSPVKPGGGLSTRTAEEQWNAEHPELSYKRALEVEGVPDYPRIDAAFFNFDKLTPEEQALTIKRAESELEAQKQYVKEQYALGKQSVAAFKGTDFEGRGMAEHKSALRTQKLFEQRLERLRSSAKPIPTPTVKPKAIEFQELQAKSKAGTLTPEEAGRYEQLNAENKAAQGFAPEPPPSPAGAGEKGAIPETLKLQTRGYKSERLPGGDNLVTYLILKSGKDVGNVQFQRVGDRYETRDMFIDPAHRGKGLAQQIVKAFSDLGYELQSTDHTSKSAAKMWERLGAEKENGRYVLRNKPTPPPSEPPSGGEGEFPVGPGTGEGPGSPHRSEVETGSGADIYGIAQRVREERAKAGQTVEVLPGKGIGAEAAVNRGRQLLSEGYDVEKALSDFEQTGAASADLVMAARAQGEILFRNARRIEEKFGTESPEFRAAFDAASRWDVRTKPLGTEAHKQFMAHQGETDIDTGSFTGIRRAYADAHDGQDLPTSKRQRAKEIAAEVYRANAEVDKANKDLIDAADKAHGADQQSYVNHFANELDKLAYQIIEAKPDISRDDLIKEIRGDLSGNYVDLSPEQVEDALSGYGKSYGPSKDPIRLKLTGYKGEMRERGKLRSMAEGEAPKRTGLQRAPATPEERALRKQVEAEKRRGGYNITDPETQLRTALQAAKTRAENAIVDLEREIANRERAVKSKPNTPTDSELEALKKKLAETRDRHAKLFGDLDLATLRQRFAGKTDAEFSPEDARAIWQTIKSRYLNQGVTDLDTVAVNAAKDLGLTPAQVIRAVVSDRGVKRMADDLWNKQAKQRLLQSEARAWVRYNDAPALLKFARMVPRFFFALKVAGHGFVWPGTHTAIHVVSPRSWGEFFPQYFASWRNVFSKGEHERYLREIQNDPLYTLTRRAGLEVDVERSVNEFANPDQAKFFRRFGSAGNRAFDSLKGLRLELFKDRWEKVPQEVRSDPKQNMAAAEALADWINHSTGALHGSTPVARALKSESLRAISFAPTLYGSRFATIGDVGRALTGFKKSATPAERFVSRQIAADAAATLGTFAGFLIINNALLSSTGSKDRVNFTDPTKPDFLAFKFGGGSYVGVGSGFVAISRLAAHLVAALYEQKKGQSSAYRTWDKLGSHILQYGRGLLAPWLSTALTAMLGFDYFKRPLPPSVQWLRKESAGLPPPKPGKNAPQLGEFQYYASEFSPIPVSEGVQVFYEDLRKNGLNHDQAVAVLRAVATGVFSGTTGFRVGEIAPDKQPEIKSPYPKLPTLPKLPKFNYVPTPQPSTNSITR